MWVSYESVCFFAFEYLMKCREVVIQVSVFGWLVGYLCMHFHFFFFFFYSPFNDNLIVGRKIIRV